MGTICDVCPFARLETDFVQRPSISFFAPERFRAGCSPPRRGREYGAKRGDCLNYTQLISVVQIEGVRLIEGGFKTKISSGEGGNDLGADLGHSVKLSHPFSEGRLTYRV